MEASAERMDGNNQNILYSSCHPKKGSNNEKIQYSSCHPKMDCMDQDIEYSSCHPKMAEHTNKPERRLARIAVSQASTLVILLSIVVGLAVGILLRWWSPWREDQLVWLALPGDLLMRMLQCLATPLVLSKLISAVGSMEVKTGGKIMMRVLVFYGCLNVVIEMTGVCVFLLVQPAGTTTHAQNASATVAEGVLPPSLAIKDLAFNMFPDNIIKATFSRYQTSVSFEDEEVRYIGEQSPAPNIIGLVVASAAIGTGIAQLGSSAATLLSSVTALSSVFSLLMEVVVTWVCPVGLVSLIATQVVRVVEPGEALSQLGMFVLTMVLGNLLLPLVVLPLVFLVVTRSNPFVFFARMSEALLVNFGTASSISTFPVTLRCLVEKNGMNEKVSGLVLSLGVLINICSYPMIATLYIAQLEDQPLNMQQVLITIIILTVIAFGTSGIPQDSFLTVVLVVGMHGLPTRHMGRILAVDWLLDRLDGLSKVVTDATAVGVVGHLSRQEADDIEDVINAEES